jgi:hypothetical protein
MRTILTLVTVQNVSCTVTNFIERRFFCRNQKIRILFHGAGQSDYNPEQADIFSRYRLYQNRTTICNTVTVKMVSDASVIRPMLCKIRFTIYACFSSLEEYLANLSRIKPNFSVINTDLREPN